MRAAWVLRGPQWHLDRCLQCNRRFADDEPGSWTRMRAEEFPELCGCQDRYRSHVNCRAGGPYCPPCAGKVAAEILDIREAYRD